MNNSIDCTQGNSFTFGTIISTFIALIFILVLIYATLKAMKVLNGKELFLRKSQNIELIESFSISRNVNIHLVRVSNKEIMIIENGNHIITKGFADGSFEIKKLEESNFSKIFSDKINNFRRKKDDNGDD